MNEIEAFVYYCESNIDLQTLTIDDSTAQNRGLKRFILATKTYIRDSFNDYVKEHNKA